MYTNGRSLSFVANTDTSEGSRWGIVLKSDYIHITDIELSDNWLKPAQTKYFDVKTVPSNATWRGVDNYDVVKWSISYCILGKEIAMKRFISLLMATLMMFTFFSCSGKVDEDKVESDIQESTTEFPSFEITFS